MAEKKTPSKRTKAKETAVQRFWTELMDNEEADMKDRLKASEFLAKSFELFDKKPAESSDGDVAVQVRYGEEDA